MLFTYSNQSSEVQPATQDVYFKVYKYLNIGWTAGLISTRFNISINHVKDVIAECKRIESLIASYLTADQTLEQPAVESMVASDIVPVDLVVGDIVRWSDGDPDIDPNWEEYKQKFIPTEEF